MIARIRLWWRTRRVNAAIKTVASAGLHVVRFEQAADALYIVGRDGVRRRVGGTRVRHTK